MSQEVFLRVFRTLHRFRGQSSLRTWIFRIVVNQVRNRQRWWRRRQRSNQVSLDEHIRDHGEMVLGADASTPDRELTRKEIGARLKTAIQNLPFEQRTALVLREVEGLKYEEIAFSLGLPVGTVKSRLTRARQALRGRAGRPAMLTWSCEQVRAELSAFYDEELPVTDRIAIADHLDGCPSCRLEADDLELIGEALQATARVEDVAVMPGLSRLQTDILERWNAEERASFGRTIRNLFDDPRRASASVGVSVVASLFLAMGAFVARAESHPPSRVAESRDDAELARPHGRHLSARRSRCCRAPYAEAIMPATVMNRDDEEVAFAALVTADGYLEDVKLIGDRIRGPAQSADARAAVRAAQCRRDRALRARPRRRRSRLAERRLAGLAHDRARARCAPTSTCASTAGRCSNYAVTKRKRKRIESRVSGTVIPCSIRFRFRFRYLAVTSPRAVAELFFAS